MSASVGMNRSMVTNQCESAESRCSNLQTNVESAFAGIRQCG